MQKKLQIEYRKVNDIIPYIGNPRKNDAAVDKVASSIKNFGFKNPIIIDKGNEIIAGHTRLKAAKKLGLEEVPTIRAEDLDEDQVKAFRLADNRTAEFAEWDDDLLGKELDDIDMDMGEFGFDESEKKKLEKVEIKEREIVPFIKVHYLITADLNLNDTILECLEQLQGKEGIEIDSSLN